jgi:hypothetical protein
MSTRNVPESEPHPHRISRILEVLTALSMTVGGGNRARGVADLSQVATGDGVLDIGYGTGGRGPRGRRRSAAVIGVEPSAVMPTSTATPATLKSERWSSLPATCPSAK